MNNNIKLNLAKVDIKVIRIPDRVYFECPYCEEDIEIGYRKFCGDIGEPSDWRYSKFDCPACEETIEIESIDWDY